MPACVIFGGSGYIGTKLALWILEQQKFEKIYLLDIKESSLANRAEVEFHKLDVRKPIELNILPGSVEWIFNFAAIHREPGHQRHEYYETNILGANQVCAFADRIACNKIFFTASISVYGPTIAETHEDTLTMPNTPYGISKLTAEYIHRLWAEGSVRRRLVSVRPGVIYGPGDPGNILRMIRAVKKGYFFLPVSPDIKKSYGYIYGLIESINFMMNQTDKVIVYNYVEEETEPLGKMIQIINETFGYRGKIIRFPFFLLKLAATIIHWMRPDINGIHPARVKKVARATHILPSVLKQRGFAFNYNFRKSLVHWKSISPSDF